MIDLEFEILSSVSLNQSAFPLVIENEQLFYKWRHLYDILYSMYDEGVNFSFPSIHSRLVEYKNQEYGNTIIAKLSQSSGLSINIKDYINQLCKLRKRESLRDLAISIQEGIKNKTLNLEEIESLIESEMEKMNNQNIDDGDMLSEFTKQTLDEIFPSEAAHKTGIPELDEKLYGIKDGQVCIIAARPSKGKTALALQICERMAKHNPEEKIILFFTQDAPREELYARLLARRSRVESWKIEYKKFDEEEGERVSIAHEFFKESGYKIKFYTNVSDINQVKAKIRKHKAVKAVFIDYIQQFSGDRKSGREAEVAGISRSIKNMAMAMKIPFIILSQLNRAIEIHNREPMFSDIRESGCLRGDTLVLDCNQKLLKEIKVLDGKKDIGIMSMKNEKGGIMQMKKGFKSGIKQLYRMELVTGHTIYATGNHKFLEYENKWEKLERLSDESLIGIPINFELKNNEKGRDLSEARFIAMMLGNGCALKNRSIQYTSNVFDDDLCDIIIKDSLKITNNKIRPYKKITNYKKRKSKWTNVFFPSIQLPTKKIKSPMVDYLKSIGIYEKRAKEKEIPGFVYFENDKFKKEFIRYLFSTDGTVSIQTINKKKISIAYTSTSYKLIFGLQLLLQSVGIVSTIKNVKQGKYEWYSLSIYSLYFQKKYLYEIGFAGKRKNNINDKAKIFLENISPGWTKYILNDKKTIAYVKIKSIYKCETTDVYDLEVPITNNFIANGIIVHNSIEQDANIILFIHSSDEERSKDIEDSNFYLAKNKNGRTGKICTNFNKPYFEFGLIGNKHDTDWINN